MSSSEVVSEIRAPIIGTSTLWRTSSAHRAPLRIGLLLDSPKLARVSARVIEDIHGSNFANIELLVYQKHSACPPERTSSLQKILRTLGEPKLRRRILYGKYLRLDARAKRANDPLALVDCSSLLSGIDAIEVEPIGKKFVQHFPPEALEQIRAKDLDVLIRFGFNILHGDILKAARHGVWSFHHGDNEFYRGGPAHFWELYERAPLSGVILQVLTEELDGGLVLCKSLFATEQTLSVSRNRYAPYWGSTDFVIRKLNELHQFGWEYVVQKAVPPTKYAGKRKLYRRPTNSEMIRWLAPALLKKAVRAPFRAHRVQHWSIGVRVGKTPLFESKDCAGVKWLEPPKGHFWADPFLLERSGRTWLFFEDYSYEDKKAHIACAEIFPDGNLATPLPCLQGPHHYSYPYVFEAGSELFMIPESFASNDVCLYRCRRFPDDWVLERTLLAGRFVDTNVWYHDGLWWLTTTKAEPDARAGCLLLYSSPSLTSGWQFHPANPISSDVRSNRGAGQVFRSRGRLIRPSQSCCPIYGYSFSFHEITNLSPTTYSERTLETITPEAWKGVCAVHTYNRAAGIEVIDGARMTPLTQLVRS